MLHINDVFSALWIFLNTNDVHGVSIMSFCPFHSFSHPSYTYTSLPPHPSYRSTVLFHVFPPLSEEILMTIFRIKPRHDIQYWKILAHVLTSACGRFSLLFRIDPYRNLILRILLSVNDSTFLTLHKSSNDILVFQYGCIEFDAYCFGIAVAFAYALVRWSSGGSSSSITININSASGVTDRSSHDTRH